MVLGCETEKGRKAQVFVVCAVRLIDLKLSCCLAHGREEDQVVMQWVRFRIRDLIGDESIVTICH